MEFLEKKTKEDLDKSTAIPGGTPKGTIWETSEETYRKISCDFFILIHEKVLELIVIPEGMFDDNQAIFLEKVTRKILKF